MSLRILGGEQIAALLTPLECIGWVERAMRAWSAGELRAPLRSKLGLIDGRGELLLMPASGYISYGAKLASLQPDNPQHGLPAIQGAIVLFDAATGTPVALLDAALITAIRTAAASALATRQLGREAATTHGIIGTGVQAHSHAEAIALVRRIRELRIWGRDADKATALAERLAAEQPDVLVRAVSRIEEAAACDVVSTVTSAAEPVLLGEHVAAGSHINLVGAHSAQTREADSALMARAAIYVDALSAARSEAGDLLIPLLEGVLSEKNIRGEIGQQLLGEIGGRQDHAEITIYKSVGFAAQDLWVAQAVLQLAEEQGAGTLVAF